MSSKAPMDGPPGQGPSGIAAGAAVQAGSTRLEGQPITPFRDRRPVVQPSSRTALYLYFWSMKGHAFTAYLRVYQPLAAFPPRERAGCAAYVETGQTLPASLLVVREERRGRARRGARDPRAGAVEPRPARLAQPHPAGRLARAAALVRPVRRRGAAAGRPDAGPAAAAHLLHGHGQGPRPGLAGGVDPAGADGGRRHGGRRRGAAGVAARLRPRQHGAARLRRTNEGDPLRGTGRGPLRRRGLGGA